MLRTIFLISTTAFWLTMMSQLIQKEYFEISTDQTPYEVIPLTTTPLREDYRAIYMGSERIGFEYHGFERVKDKKGYEFNQYDYELRHTSYMSFLLLGRKNELFLKGLAWMDDRFHLNAFQVNLQSMDYKTKIQGKVAGNQIEIKITEGDGAPVTKIVPFTGDLIYLEALENIWTPKNLSVGRRGRYKVLNPLLLNVEDLNFRVDKKKMIKHQSKDTEVYEVVLGDRSSQTKSLINKEGLTLRKELSNGLVLASEPGWEIFDALRKKSAAPPDLPNLFSIPTNRELKNPADLKKLKLKIQTPQGENTLVFVKETLDGLDTIKTGEIDPIQMKEYLSATDSVQSTDPEIAAQAKKIVAGETRILAAALKIMRWVHETVAPRPTLTIPSAKQVLAAKIGDCNEYTVLFTALARASGIPTRMIAGLVYQNGRFFYHAWAGVFAGKWIGLDPTFDQAPVDITHIALISGELEEQVRLADKIGQVRIEILEAE